jgi:hypothetical protein
MYFSYKYFHQYLLIKFIIHLIINYYHILVDFMVILIKYYFQVHFIMIMCNLINIILQQDRNCINCLLYNFNLINYLFEFKIN